MRTSDLPLSMHTPQLASSTLPESPLGSRLWDLFGRYPWSFIEKHDGDRDWRTETRYPLKPRVLWSRWQDAAVQIGVRFGSSTSYCVIDIDKGSPYLTTVNLSGIKGALETIGIVRSVVIRSSWSGGLHLFCPLPHAVGTFNLAVALKGCLEAHGFKLKAGELETMPNVKAFGRHWLKEFIEFQGHRLPLQPGSGSVMLNDQFQPVGDRLERFFWSWEFAQQQQDMELLGQALATAQQQRRKHKTVNTPFEQWRTDLQGEISEGWTGFGQTNGLLKAIATYGRVFLKLSGSDLAAYTADTARGCPGFQSWCQHAHEIARKALCWARSVEKYYFPSGSATEGVRPPAQHVKVDGNKERSWDAKQRIANAVRALLAEGAETLTTATAWANAIVARAKCSTRTLYRYIELWHPTRGDTQAYIGERCKTPDGASDRTPQIAANPDPTPPHRKGAKALVDNVFLHLRGGMKSESAEIAHQKNLSDGNEWGYGGEKGFSTAPEGV
jgi:hypothetical protein